MGFDLDKLPNGWSAGRLSDLCVRVQDAATPLPDGKRLYLGLEHLASGFPSLVGKGNETDVCSGKTAFHSGDILFGKLRPYLRKSVMVKEDGICSTDILVFRPTEKCLPEFLSYFTHTDEFVNHAKSTTSGVQHPRTSWSSLSEFKLPVPPIPEQRKIAGVLGVVQQAIEQQEQLLQRTTELKKTLLHKLFTEGLRGEPQKQTEIGPVPESWEITDLGKVINFFNGYAFKSEESIATSNTQLVRMGNLYQNRLDLTRSPIFYPDAFAQKLPRFILKTGDLIMSLTGTSGKEDYGFTVELKPVTKTLLLNQRIARIDIASDQLAEDYLLYFLLSRKFLDNLYRTAKGMKQANLSTHAMRRLKIPIPSVHEQEAIAGHFRVIDHKIEFHQAKLDSLRDLFRTLLHQLMTAQIRVNDIELADIKT